MAIAQLNNENYEVHDGLGSIVVMRDVADVPGGRTINCERLAEGTTVVGAGHVIIANDTTGEAIALGISDNAYESLPAGHSYLGILKMTILVSDPRGAILTMGQVNAAAAAKYAAPITSTIKAALPQINFMY